MNNWLTEMHPMTGYVVEEYGELDVKQAGSSTGRAKDFRVTDRFDKVRYWNHDDEPEPTDWVRRGPAPNFSQSRRAAAVQGMWQVSRTHTYTHPSSLFASRADAASAAMGQRLPPDARHSLRW